MISTIEAGSGGPPDEAPEDAPAHAPEALGEAIGEARRKAAVVEAVNQGELSVEEACALHGMSLDEFSAWDRALHNFGLIGRR